ncbi:STAS-like domain-containing protein [Burkholderia territorii]|uniref:STAS-like domain-containing protein n=1 Tax=Burkholderia territorii TaxID=1503055 RepID=UPI0009BE6C9F|nr:STAS-like domain-containing protein [Burkholderia territorii]
MTKINVARDFTRWPAGRYRADGPYSGEVFRDEVLVPALARAEVVEVELDGTRGYGSSFLEEAFGGLVRLGRFTSEQLLQRIRLTSKEDPTLSKEIQYYIKHSHA